jgi:hypothetical protein
MSLGEKLQRKTRTYRSLLLICSKNTLSFLQNTPKSSQLRLHQITSAMKYFVLVSIAVLASLASANAILDKRIPHEDIALKRAAEDPVRGAHEDIPRKRAAKVEVERLPHDDIPRKRAVVVEVRRSAHEDIPRKRVA